MKEKVSSNKFILHILAIACVFYLPCTLFINLICHFVLNGRLLQAWANLIVFFIVFIFALILNIKTKFLIKNGIIRNIGYIYSILSFSINLLVFILEDGKMWTILSMLLILLYSIIASILLQYLKIGNYLVRSLIYYVVSIVSFMILTVGIAKYTEGNSTMLLFGIFTIVYIIIAIVYFYIKRSFYSYENKEKAYKRQFD